MPRVPTGSPGRAGAARAGKYGKNTVWVKLDLNSKRALVAKLDRHAEKKRRQLEKVNDKYLALIFEEARRAVPVRTGSLKETIRIIKKDLAGTVAAGAGGVVNPETGREVDYARFVELGTRLMEAQPFLFPAFEKYRDRWFEEVRDIMSSL